MLPLDPNCIFCKIVSGAIPCHKVYEDEHVLAFLDINPVSYGHVLLIPKGHWARLEEVPHPVSAQVGGVLPQLGRAVAAASGLADWNLLQNNGKPAGQVVEHVHFHLIPRKVGDGLGFRWPAGKLLPGDARVLVEALTQSLSR